MHQFCPISRNSIVCRDRAAPARRSPHGIWNLKRDWRKGTDIRTMFFRETRVPKYSLMRNQNNEHQDSSRAFKDKFKNGWELFNNLNCSQVLWLGNRKYKCCNFHYRNFSPFLVEVVNFVVRATLFAPQLSNNLVKEEPVNTSCSSFRSDTVNNALIKTIIPIPSPSTKSSSILKKWILSAPQYK